MRLEIHIDGGSRGNPGPAACAMVLTDPQSSKVICEAGYFLGEITNNVAEYTGLVLALQKARQLNAHDILIHSDSELMVRQITGRYRVKSPDLKPLFQQAQSLLSQFTHWEMKHVYRESNARADALVNFALDLGQNVGDASDTPLPPAFSSPLFSSSHTPGISPASPPASVVTLFTDHTGHASLTCPCCRQQIKVVIQPLPSSQ